MVRFPRDIAVRVLTRVLSDREPLDEALVALSGECVPEARGWLQDVCSGTLRWKGRIDFILDSIALKKKPSGWLRKVLSIAVYQLIAQEKTHPGVVVSETVAEVKAKEGDAPARFANALLRKVSDHLESWRERRPPADARQASLPEWFWNRLVRDHGLAWAQAYALASLERPGIWVRSRAWPWTVGAEIHSAQAGPIPQSWLLTEGGAIKDLPGFEQGEFFVQDISSQSLVDGICREVTSRLSAEPGTIHALDLCAAPGGKSAGMAWNGLSVTATDQGETRMRLLAETAKRVGASIRVIQRAEVPGLEAQDLVWVDAPCTGTGILRRHPDVRWLRQEKELPGLLDLQERLLREAWTKVKGGGFLAYSVCSVLKDEGPAMLERAGLRNYLRREWFLVPQEPPYGDGFWAGLLQKGEK